MNAPEIVLARAQFKSLLLLYKGTEAAQQHKTPVHGYLHRQLYYGYLLNSRLAVEMLAVTHL